MRVVPSSRRGRILLGAGVAAALVAALTIVAVALAGGDGDRSATTTAAPSTTSTTAAPSTTVAPSTTAAPTTTTQAPAPPFEGSAPEVVLAASGAVRSANLASAEATAVERMVFEPVLPGAFTVDSRGRWRQNTTVVATARIDPGPPVTITYRVAPNATWSDGVPVDCDDFRLAWVAGRGITARNGSLVFGPSATPAYADVVAVDCPDDPKQVRVELARPVPEWRALFAHLVPAHAVTAASGVADPAAAVGQARTIARVADAWRQVLDLEAAPETSRLSAGPYRLAEWVPGERAVLERNPAWWGVPPALDRVVVALLPDGAAQVAALGEGTVDVVTGPFAPEQVVALGELGEVQVHRVGTFDADQLLFNLRNPLFQQRTLREAFARCVPRQDIAERLGAGGTGSGVVLGNLVQPPTQAGYADLMPPTLAYDPSGARAALVADGWTVGADGVLRTPYKRLSVRLLRLDEPRAGEAAAAVVEGCRRAGIEVVDEPLEAEEYIARLADGTFDLAVTQASLGPDQLQSATRRFTAEGDANLGRYVSTDAEALIATWGGEASMAPPPAPRQLAEVLWRDLPALPITQPAAAVAHRTAVWGVQPNPAGPVTWNVASWRVDPA